VSGVTPGRGDPEPVVTTPEGLPAGVVATTLACAGCGTVANADEPLPFRCPAARPGDDIDHVMARTLDLDRLEPPGDPDPNPFVRYRTLLRAYHAARAAGWTDGRFVDLVRSLDDAVAAVDGRGFRATPFAREAALGARLGMTDGGSVWVKDETGNVSGSHKARHLFGLLLELRVAEAVAGVDASRPLAIASCGNAALAAAVVARAAGRELRVFVPDVADPAVVDRLRSLGADVTVCPRRAGEVGDPSVLRLRAALAAGAIPFTCQGDENGLVIQGGATLGWEMLEAARDAGIALDRLVIQVGGGALASAQALACQEARALGVIERVPRLDAVQTRGAWPLVRAWGRVVDDLGLEAGVPVEPRDLAPGLATVARARSRYMWAWETEPHSVAHGIIDDETYDWLAVVAWMVVSGGRGIVADEATLVAANELARATTGIDADETGTAGLAGLLHLRREGLVDPGETVAVVFSGVRRGAPAVSSASSGTATTPTTGPAASPDVATISSPSPLPAMPPDRSTR
jgi:threonine synthase